MMKIKQTMEWHAENLKNHKASVENEMKKLVVAIDEYARIKASYVQDFNTFSRNVRLGKKEW
jgi:hypothetical protein